MIGHLVAAYCEGRDDARHGRERERDAREASDVRKAYRLGLLDERRRMRDRGELPQIAMPGIR